MAESTPSLALHDGQPRDFRASLLAMCGISLVMLLSSLEQTIVGNALPSIVNDLKDFDLYAWVATSYLLASMVAIPITGRLGDYYGRKPFVLASTLIFTLGSVWCGLAREMLELVFARGLQGIGGGMVIGSAFACIPELFPDTHRRLRWQIILSVVSSVANAAGPALGGYVSSHYGWRYVFWLNIPLGFIALLFAWRFLPYFPPRARGKPRVDWPGAVMVAAALISLQLLVEWLPERHLQLICGLAGILAISAVGLCWWEPRARDPLLPGALFAHHALRKLYYLALLIGGVMFSFFIYLPLLFQGGYGFAASDAGVLITPLALCMTLGAIVNGRLVTRIPNPSLLPFLGVSLLLLASLGFAFIGTRAGFSSLLALTFTAGCGLGFTLINLTLFTQSLTQPQHMGIATAMQKSLRLVGALIATAVMGTLVKSLYQFNVTRIFTRAGQVQHIMLYNDPQMLIRSGQPIDALHQTLLPLARQALLHAMSMSLAFVALLAVIALILIAKLPSIPLSQKTSDK
ncbi:MFS transporter [Erwinia typographi]|uniref:MFS transporter n=1 Tax=Erwinia typographi TaxID=371042 RepID=UPI000691A4AB|nr:MFS transporter [Erwinia typographi]